MNKDRETLLLISNLYKGTCRLSKILKKCNLNKNLAS